MKTYKGSRCIDPRFLDTRISWRLVVNFTARALYSRERAPGTHWIGGWVGPRTGLDDMEKKRVPYRDSNFDTSAVQPVVIPTELSRLHIKHRKI
jgi:hypothetical protein